LLVGIIGSFLRLASDEIFGGYFRCYLCLLLTVYFAEKLETVQYKRKMKAMRAAAISPLNNIFFLFLLSTCYLRYL
jgi:hypothetical protein